MAQTPSGAVVKQRGMMRAVVIDQFGGPEVLRVRDVVRPEPSSGQLLVRVFAVGANPLDAQTRADGSQAGVNLPAILGWEISGVVEAAVDGVCDFAPGDEVFYMADFLGGGPGGYAEYHVVDEHIVARKPSELDHAQAAALPLAAGTAEQVVTNRLQARPGEWVLVHGASGGVGSYAVQIAKARGARVVASASGARERYLRALGADVFVDYRAGDPFRRAAQAVGQELDAVADLYGHGSVSRALAFVREGGRIATIVELKGDFELAIDRNIALHGVLVRPSRALLESLCSRVSRLELKPTLEAIYDLDHVRQLHERLDSGHAQGKAVLAMPILTSLLDRRSGKARE